MLKIKDNIDLKELEKYGFEYQDSDWYIQKRYINGEMLIYLDDLDIERHNVFESEQEANKFLDTLYDLIKADLVEKVD